MIFFLLFFTYFQIRKNIGFILTLNEQEKKKSRVTLICKNTQIFHFMKLIKLSFIYTRSFCWLSLVSDFWLKSVYLVNDFKNMSLVDSSDFVNSIKVYVLDNVIFWHILSYNVVWCVTAIIRLCTNTDMPN